MTAAGCLLESQFDRVGRWMNQVRTGILITLVLIYLYRVLLHRS